MKVLSISAIYCNRARRRPMSTTAFIDIGSHLWNARLYEGLSVASELAANFDQPVEASPPFLHALQIYRLAGLRNRSLEEILAGIDQVIETQAKHTAQPENQSEAYREASNILSRL